MSKGQVSGDQTSGDQVSGDKLSYTLFSKFSGLNPNHVTRGLMLSLF